MLLHVSSAGILQCLLHYIDVLESKQCILQSKCEIILHAKQYIVLVCFIQYNPEFLCVKWPALLTRLEALVGQREPKLTGLGKDKPRLSV